MHKDLGAKDNTYIINPGSFEKHKQFTIIYPLKNKVEESELD